METTYENSLTLFSLLL